MPADNHNHPPDSPLAAPYVFRIIIEGGVEAVDEGAVRDWCLNSLSFTATFGQSVASVRVQSKLQPVGQKAGLFGPDGIKFPPKP